MDEQAHQYRSHKINALRRGVGIVICFAPIILLIGSLAHSEAGESTEFLGLCLAVAALALGSLNAYLSFVRPFLYSRRQGSMEAYRHVSGLPVIGTVFVVVAGVAGFGQLPTTIVGLAAVIIDPGGLPWFLVSTWRDEALWDT